jgi:hypothetical protein
MERIRQTTTPPPNRSARRKARREMEAELARRFAHVPAGAAVSPCGTCGEPTPMRAFIEGIDLCVCGRSSNHDAACLRPRCILCYTRVMMQTR